MQRLGSIVRGEMDMGDTSEIECAKAGGTNNKNNGKVGDL
jgi:hypothetical protein